MRVKMTADLSLLDDIRKDALFRDFHSQYIECESEEEITAFLDANPLFVYMMLDYSEDPRIKVEYQDGV